MFSYQEVGLALDSRECVVLHARRRGDVEEQRTPALAQISGREIRAVGQRAFRLVGKSNDIVCVFPGRIEDPLVLSGYLEIVVPPTSSWATATVVGDNPYRGKSSIAIEHPELSRPQHPL